MQIGSSISPAAVAVLACGCGHIDVSHVIIGPTAEAAPDEARLPAYFNEAPERPYAEIAEIRIRAWGSDATVEAVVGAAVEDARALGADAVIVDLRRHFESVQAQVSCIDGPRVDPEGRLNARATAIRFLQPGEAEPRHGAMGPAPRLDRCEEPP